MITGIFKNTLLICTLMFIMGCGYEPIYSKKNIVVYNFSLDNVVFTGDRDINIKIQQELRYYSTTKKNKYYDLTITSNSEKEVLTRDSTGRATIYQNNITVNASAISNLKVQKTYSYSESFKYKNDENKLVLREYEKQIKSNLAETISKELILRLSRK